MTLTPKARRRRRRAARNAAAEAVLASPAVVNSPPHVRRFLEAILLRGERAAGTPAAGRREGGTAR
jgi:hypothetical protein